jgi:hypothetical protein
MLLWIDGFEGYAGLSAYTTVAEFNTRYPILNIVDSRIRAGRVTGLCLELQPGHYLQTPALTTDDTLIFGGGFNIDAPPGIPSTLISFYDGVTPGLNLKINVANQLCLYKDSTLIATSVNSLAQGVWYYLEIKIVAGATGTYDVYLDKTNIFTSASYDTRPGANDYNDRLKLQSCGRYLKWDDIYICDSTGAINNDILNPCRVLTASPDGDNSVNWSTVYPANSDHYADVDDPALWDEDTTYVEDATTGHKDLYDYAAVTVFTEIFGVAINTVCRVTDANSVDLKTVIESGGTDQTLATDTISSTTYSIISNISETDPNTSAAWDVTDLNAAHFGIEVG